MVDVRRFFGLTVLVWLVLASVVHAEPAPTAAEIADKVMPAVVQVVTDITYNIRSLAWHESAFGPPSESYGIGSYGSILHGGYSSSISSDYRQVNGKWYVVEKGQWEKDIKVRISGSGSVIYSGPDLRYLADTGRNRDVTYVLTNWHVIAFALPGAKLTVERYPKQAWSVENYRWKLDANALPDAEIQVTKVELGLIVLPDQQAPIPARPEWWNEKVDVALVAVDNVGGVPTVPLGDSDAMKVGDRLFIAGAPLGIPFAFTEGRLSQKNLTIDDDWVDMWRYDIAQNPGSSGSALFNEKGEVVGIVRGSFVLSWWFPAAFEGGHLGIPINTAKFLLRWQGYGFILTDDIIEKWKARKYGR